MRVVIFTDVNGEVPRALTRATLGAARRRDDVELAAVVVSRPERFGLRGTHAQRFARETLVARCNRDVALRGSWERSTDLLAILRRHGIPVVKPPKADPNDPAFGRHLRDDLRADVALSFYSLRIFGAPLLEQFEHAINFHNGLLPQYKGLMATSFALYNGEPRVGYTFHRMTTDLDGGPILIQGSVAVDPCDCLAAVTTRLARQAADEVPRLLDGIATDNPGRAQSGPSSYYSSREAQDLMRVETPSTLTADELFRRVRAFGTLELTIDGTRSAVTHLRRATRSAPLAFRSADGHRLVADRLGGLPPWMRRLRRLRRLGGRG